MKRFLSLVVALSIALMVSISVAQLRSDQLFPWASGLAIPGLQVGILGPNTLNGTPMAAVQHGTCSVVFGSIGAGVCSTQSCAIVGALATDRVTSSIGVDFATSTLPTCAQSATATNGITIKCCNQSAGALTPGTGTFVYHLIRP